MKAVEALWWLECIIFTAMRAVVQRVSQASVSVREEPRGAIGSGLLILLGIEDADEEEDARWLAGKIASLRVFPDEEGKMNRSIVDIGGEGMVVSQFTLHGNARKGTRPSFVRAAAPDHAIPLYERFIERFEEALGKKVATGEFGGDMQVELCNDGPVTLILDTKQKDF